MADLTDKEASLATKLLGANSTGIEENFARVDALGRLYVNQLGAPTFMAYASSVQVGNNKSMISIQNTSDYVVRLIEIKIINNQTSALTGVIGIFQLHRIASFTDGISITPQSNDTMDILPSGISVATGSTVSGEGVLLSRRVFSTDEWGTGAQDVESMQHSFQSIFPQWRYGIGTKPLTIRNNQGMHIKFATNSTNGFFDFELIFTVESE